MWNGNEPEGKVILRSQIPPAYSPNVEKGYWDAVVRRLALLTNEEALQLSLAGERITMSMKSSLATAAGRAGRRVTILVRGDCVYAWISGECEKRRHRPPRPSFNCEVCGRVIVPPKSGASIQYVCSGAGPRNWCRRVRRFAQVKGMTIRDADHYLRDWHARRKDGRVAA